jgi:hypothetical protein
LLGQADPLHQAILPDDAHLVSTNTVDKLIRPRICISASDSDPEHGTHGVPSQTELLDIDISTQDCISELGTGDPSLLKATTGDTVANFGLDVDDNSGTEHGTSSGVPSQSVKHVNVKSSNQALDSEPGMSDVPSQSKSLLGHSLGQNTGRAAVNSVACLNPSAVPFVAGNRILGGLGQDDVDDLHQVLQVQAGGVGRLDHGGQELWDAEVVSGSRPTQVPRVEQHITEELPFSGVDDISDMLGLAPKDIHRVGVLPDMRITLPVGEFCDKVLPPPSHPLKVNQVFTPDYFVALHNITAAAGVHGDGSTYGTFTPNHLGARVSLPHTKLRLERWRYHLRGYDKVEICQLIEFGFPVGVDTNQELECKTRNHGSSYMWYSHVDKFITKEVVECGVTGPYTLSPWKDIVISPLMTAHKKPRGRRTVFDATYGELSVNNATPGDKYMGETTTYTYPKVEDYRLLVLKAGKGCFMWKRDLARFFLQLPMDPVDYSKVALVWRGLFFFFVGLAFGLRHSGLNGQRVTDAVSWILRCFGLETDAEKPYNVVNYVDDLGGVEKTLSRAVAAFEKLGWLLSDLGLVESSEKAESPTTQITYLGVEFDSQAMQMRVPAEKLQEIKSEIRLWLRRTTISKKDLQSLLGKLFWVGRVVKHSRVFLGRLLDQLRSMAGKPDNKKVKLLEQSRKDILWWASFMEHYNGVEVITIEDPIKLSYQQLLDTPHDICAGDATPVGGGAWHGYEYWCGPLPETLQDPQVPIHLKEFWVLVVSAKQWGDTWTGRAVVLYCDNDAVCEVIWNKKPRDQAMLSLLREFLHIVVTKKFFPVVRKISSGDNHLADHISRRFDEGAADKEFSKAGLQGMVRVMPKRTFFNLSATW